MTYTAVARLVGGWWAITVPEIPGVFSQARRLDQVEDMARKALALLLDAVPDSFDIVVQRGLPAEAPGKGGRAGSRR